MSHGGRPIFSRKTSMVRHMVSVRAMTQERTSGLWQMAKSKRTFESAGEGSWRPFINIALKSAQPVPFSTGRYFSGASPSLGPKTQIGQKRCRFDWLEHVGFSQFASPSPDLRDTVAGLSSANDYKLIRFEVLVHRLSTASLPLLISSNFELIATNVHTAPPA